MKVGKIVLSLGLAAVSVPALVLGFVLYVHFSGTLEMVKISRKEQLELFKLNKKKENINNLIFSKS